MRIRLSLLALLVLAGACGNEEAQRFTLNAAGEDQSRLAAEVQGPIDNGNAAFRARDYEAALAYYRQAAELAPEEATAWFGISMAAEALGDQALADTARAQINRLAPELMAEPHTSGATGGSPPSGMNHPVVPGMNHPVVPGMP
jgi:Flp pilus assembly protein TadD